MKNKTIKNLIVLGSFVVLLVAFDIASAAEIYNTPNVYNQYGYKQSMTDLTPASLSYYNNMVYPQTQNNYPQTANYTGNYATTQPYTYVQPASTYIATPTTQPVQYIQKGTNSQTAQVVKTVTPVSANKVMNTSTNGGYVNYDGYDGNTLGASAYGAQGNGLTALSVNGSNSFMPSSIFQWFLVILLILAIIIIARMIGKSFNKDNHSAPIH